MTAALGAAAVALAVFFLLYARQRRVCRQIGDLADRMNVCMEQLRTAETAAEYAGLWQQMEDDAEAIAAWQGRIRLWDRSIDLAAGRQRVEQLRENYQWWLRDAMERQKDRALREVKTTYRNSTAHKAAIYGALAEDWEGVSHLFSPETARFADGAMEEIYRSAGAGFERCASFAREPRPGEGERSAAVAEKLAWADRMDGREFEYFCADLLRRNGFTDVDVTAGSVTLKMTVTDADGDSVSATADLGSGNAIEFKDDGPTISATEVTVAEKTLSVDETTLGTAASTDEVSISSRLVSVSY